MVVGVCGRHSVFVRKHVVVEVIFEHVLAITQSQSMVALHAQDLQLNQDHVVSCLVLLMETGHRMGHGVNVQYHVVWELKQKFACATTLLQAMVVDLVLASQVLLGHVEKT